MGLISLALVYCGIINGAWFLDRQVKERIRQEKMTGRLPERRSPNPPSSMSPIIILTVILLVVFAPVVVWFLIATVQRLLTPPSARQFLVPPRRSPGLCDGT